MREVSFAASRLNETALVTQRWARTACFLAIRRVVVPFVVEIAPETFMVVIIVDIVTRVARDYGAVD